MPPERSWILVINGTFCTSRTVCKHTRELLGWSTWTEVWLCITHWQSVSLVQQVQCTGAQKLSGTTDGWQISLLNYFWSHRRRALKATVQQRHYNLLYHECDCYIHSLILCMTRTVCYVVCQWVCVHQCLLVFGLRGRAQRKKRRWVFHSYIMLLPLNVPTATGHILEEHLHAVCFYSDTKE